VNTGYVAPVFVSRLRLGVRIACTRDHGEVAVLNEGGRESEEVLSSRPGLRSQAVRFQIGAPWRSTPRATVLLPLAPAALFVGASASGNYAEQEGVPALEEVLDGRVAGERAQCVRPWSQTRARRRSGRANLLRAGSRAERGRRCCP
jgi:hypothetical protein